MAISPAPGSVSPSAFLIALALNPSIAKVAAPEMAAAVGVNSITMPFEYPLIAGIRVQE